MKVKTSEAKDQVLSYLVAKCEGKTKLYQRKVGTGSYLMRSGRKQKRNTRGACRLLCTNGKRLGSMASINPCGRLLII
jgi:hypothetical protein